MRGLAWVTVAGVAAAAAGCLAVPKWPAEAAVTADADHADAALALAADCLDRGDEPAAVPHLAAYVRANPDAHLTRLHLAELLARHGDPAAAEAEFERFLADAPDAGPAHGKRPQCHTRLMALAEARGDAYAEHLHRGAGLVRLAEKWAADPDRRDAVLTEQTLAKAVAALQEACADRPTDARANLYLAAAYARLGHPAAARRALDLARAGLPDPRLSEAELERLVAGE